MRKNESLRGRVIIKGTRGRGKERNVVLQKSFDWRRLHHACKISNVERKNLVSWWIANRNLHVDIRRGKISRTNCQYLRGAVSRPLFTYPSIVYRIVVRMTFREICIWRIEKRRRLKSTTPYIIPDAPIKWLNSHDYSMIEICYFISSNVQLKRVRVLFRIVYETRLIIVEPSPLYILTNRTKQSGVNARGIKGLFSTNILQLHMHDYDIYTQSFSRYFVKIFSLANFSRQRVIKNDRGNSMETRGGGEWSLCVRELLAGRLPGKLVKNWSKVSHFVGSNQIVTIIWGLARKCARKKGESDN